MADSDLPDFDALWDYDKPAATEQRFRELLPRARACGDRSYLLQLLTQIARTEGLQHRFDDTHRTLDEVAEALDDDLPLVRIRYLLERGRTFNSSGDPATAEPLFHEAWDLGRAHGEDACAVDAAHMLAIVVIDHEQQMSWNLRALELAERSSAPSARRWLGSLYNNIGWTQHDGGRYDEALATFHKALCFREEQGTAGDIRVARWCVARTLRSLGRYDEALAMQHDLLQEMELSGDTDGYVHEELGEGLLALGREDEARGHFALAHAMLSPDHWLATNEAARLQRLKDLGGV